MCVICAILLLSTTPIGALTSSTITIDGDLGDWFTPLSDADNVIPDPFGDSPDDPDHNRDLVQAAATWDTTNLYLLFRRASIAGDAQLVFVAYVDVDGDRVMETTDRMLLFSFTGSGAPNTAEAYSYVPKVAGGDPMTGDNEKMPGKASQNPLGGSLLHARDAANIACEARVDWATLGVAPGSPINIKFGCGGTANNIGDNTNILSLLRRGVSLTPEHQSAAAENTTIELPHTLTNEGNATETFAVSASSAQGWPVSVRAGAEATTSVVLARDASMTLYLRVTVPPGTPAGARDSITVQAASAANPLVKARVVDRVYVGALLVIPDNEGSMAPGQEITYRTNVVNNSSVEQTISVSTIGDLGWESRVVAQDGVTTVTEVVVPGHTSLPLLLKVSVPATATAEQERTVMRASLASSPEVHADGLNFTTARPALEVTPNRTTFGGDNSYVWFRHTVRNSWPTTRTVSIAGQTVRGWPCATFALDGTTPKTTIEVGPNGGTTDFMLRVLVPAGLPVGDQEAVTASATAGPHSGSAHDLIRIAKLATYGSGGWTTPTDHFMLGSAVWGRAMGVTPGTSVTFNWRDTGGNLVLTQTRLADAQGTAWSSHTPSGTGALGTWTLESVIGALSTTVEFTVSYDAAITDTWATDIPVVGGSSEIGAVVHNRGTVELPASRVDYLVWWDADASGDFGVGDLYITTASLTETYTGGVIPVTNSGAVDPLPPDATYADSWLLCNEAFTKGGTWNVSISWDTTAGNHLDTAANSFYSAMSALNMRISTSWVDFGDVEPEDTANIPVTLTVNSTRMYDLSTSYVNAEALGLTTALGPQIGVPAGNRTYDDALSILVPWTTEGPVLSEVVYTVVLR